MEESELIYQIAITKVDGVGPNLAKSLIAYCGSASAVFKQKKTELKKIPGIGAITAANISKFQNFKTIENEMNINSNFGLNPFPFCFVFLVDLFPKGILHRMQFFDIK